MLQNIYMDKCTNIIYIPMLMVNVYVYIYIYKSISIMFPWVLEIDQRNNSRDNKTSIYEMNFLSCGNLCLICFHILLLYIYSLAKIYMLK